MGVECASCGQAIPPGQFRCGSCGAVQTRESFDDYGGLTEVAEGPESAARPAPETAARPVPEPPTRPTPDVARPAAAMPVAAAAAPPAPANGVSDDEEAAREPVVPRGTFASELPDRGADGDERELMARPEPAKPKPASPATAAGSSPSQRVKTVSAPRAPARPPYLASEILREDIAPSEPARGLIQVVLQVAPALGVIAALFSGLSRSATWVSITALAAVFLLTRVELTYPARAMLVTATGGGALAVLSLWRIGLGGGSAGPLLAIATTLLSASLLFRSWYRAAPAARVLVGIALVLAVAWAGLTSHRELLSLQFTWQSWLPALTWYLFSILCLLSLLAFMGGETTGGCDFWALGLLVWYGLYAAVRFALESADPAHAPSPNGQTLGLIEPALAAPTAVALAQVMARTLGARPGRRTTSPAS